MTAVDLHWYVRRLRRMSASEVAWRAVEQARRRAWARRQVTVADTSGARPPLSGAPAFLAVLPEGALGQVPDAARGEVLRLAEAVLSGRWDVLGATRTDMADPDWFSDPVTGRRAPDAAYCFSIDHRAEAVTGNVKQIWELSRMHHVTVLAAAYALSHDERFATVADRHLRSWWVRNPFLSGVNWTSGIEVGMRLLAWVWARRLLAGWPGAAGLFERNELALRQIWWHQRYLEAFRSRGSSANNHVIAEAAGQLVASLAFPWFAESGRWQEQAAALLERELHANTFPSGMNRELAFDYHGFVAELAIVAGVEADLAGRPLGRETWRLVARMLDVVAASLDETLRAPRQGDGDDGRGLLLGPSADRWSSLLAFGAAVIGAPAWWPAVTGDAAAALLAAAAAPHPVPDRPASRPSHLPDAGLTILRSRPGDGPEIWCRCDGGPHGYLSIASHAHADALAVEVRHGGVDVLADPGTYCYHGEPEWRSYFRSTLGHNTVELAGRSQSASGGPFLWTRHAGAQVVEVGEEDGAAVAWCAEHDGYAALDPPARHRRTVRLRSAERAVEIVDRIDTTGRHPLRLAFHLGPDVGAALEGRSARLWWAAGRGEQGEATLELPDLAWWQVRGGTDPVLGWYSPGFGEKRPTTVLLGEGMAGGVRELRTVVRFAP